MAQAQPVFKILIAVGALLAFFGIKALADFQGFKASAIRVTAVVDGRTAKSVENRTPREATLSLRYEYQGNIMHVTTHAIDKYYEPLKVGDSVELVLMAGNPSKFMPAEALSRAGILGPYLIGAGSLLMIFSFILSRR